MTARVSFSGIPPILAILAILFIIAPISADLVKGTYYQILSVENPPQSNTTIFYYNNITPQNDPKEWRVYPGDTLYLGGTYDLSYVTGTTKQFAWWKDWKYESTDCNPDVVNSVSYIDTNGRINPKMVYLDPEKYKVGNWWQWDGCFIDPSPKKNGEIHWLPYKNDNSLAFRIIYPPVWPPITPTPAPTPQQIYIPTPTPLPITTMPTINSTPAETPVQKGGLPWQVYVGVGFVIVVIILGVLLL